MGHTCGITFAVLSPLEVKLVQGKLLFAMIMTWLNVALDGEGNAKRVPKISFEKTVGAYSNAVLHFNKSFRSEMNDEVESTFSPVCQHCSATVSHCEVTLREMRATCRQ